MDKGLHEFICRKEKTLTLIKIVDNDIQIVKRIDIGCEYGLITLSTRNEI